MQKTNNFFRHCFSLKKATSPFAAFCALAGLFVSTGGRCLNSGWIYGQKENEKANSLLNKKLNTGVVL